VTAPRYPSLYQINTRVWLTELSRTLGRPATLDDIPDGELDRLAKTGFDWVWFLSVWQTGPAGQRVSRSNQEWRREFQETLQDLREEDIPGSGFAIAGYTVHGNLGGDAALARLREGHARPVRDHLRADLNYQNKMARFLENHDEPRAAATFAPGIHEAAAVITFLSPGLRFFHQGQFEGRRKRISPHLVRAPVEPVDDTLRRFYDRLLTVLRRPAARYGSRIRWATPATSATETTSCHEASISMCRPGAITPSR